MNAGLGDSLYGRFESGLQDEYLRLPEGSRVGQGQSTLKTWACASPPEVEGEGEREKVVRPEVLIAQAQQGLGRVMEIFPAYAGWQASYCLRFRRRA